MSLLVWQNAGIRKLIWTLTESAAKASKSSLEYGSGTLYGRSVARQLTDCLSGPKASFQRDFKLRYWRAFGIGPKVKTILKIKDRNYCDLTSSDWAVEDVCRGFTQPCNEDMILFVFRILLF
jgi:hypothetical protein